MTRPPAQWATQALADHLEKWAPAEHKASPENMARPVSRVFPVRSPASMLHCYHRVTKVLQMRQPLRLFQAESDRWAQGARAGLRDRPDHLDTQVHEVSRVRMAHRVCQEAAALRVRPERPVTTATLVVTVIPDLRDRLGQLARAVRPARLVQTERKV